MTFCLLGVAVLVVVLMVKAARSANDLIARHCGDAAPYPEPGGATP